MFNSTMNDSKNNLTWSPSTKSGQSSLNVPKSWICPSVMWSRWSLSSTYSVCGVESLMELCLALRFLHLRQAEAITEADVHDVQVSPLGDSTASSGQSNYNVSVPLTEEPESCRWIQQHSTVERQGEGGRERDTADQDWGSHQWQQSLTLYNNIHT